VEVVTSTDVAITVAAACGSSLVLVDSEVVLVAEAAAVEASEDSEAEVLVAVVQGEIGKNTEG
jgi:hypothetical protein